MALMDDHHPPTERFATEEGDTWVTHHADGPCPSSGRAGRIPVVIHVNINLPGDHVSEKMLLWTLNDLADALAQSRLAGTQEDT